MPEYIDKQAFLDYMKRTARYFNVKFDIESFPNADVAPVVHGRWIMVDDSCGKYACSACREIEQECTEWGAGHYNPVDKDYCPNCGAKMDEKEDKHEDYT